MLSRQPLGTRSEARRQMPGRSNTPSDPGPASRLREELGTRPLDEGLITESIGSEVGSTVGQCKKVGRSRIQCAGGTGRSKRFPPPAPASGLRLAAVGRPSVDDYPVGPDLSIPEPVLSQA
jgi:hypothetical protein